MKNKKGAYSILYDALFLLEKMPLKQAELFTRSMVNILLLEVPILIPKVSNGNFDVNDKPRYGWKEMKKDLEALLAKNAASVKLTKQFVVNHTIVLWRLCIWKDSEGMEVNPILTIRMNYWQSVQHLHLTANSTKKEEFFMENSNWRWEVIYDNPKRKKWLDPGQPFISIPKCDIHGYKILFCIRWD